LLSPLVCSGSESALSLLKRSQDTKIGLPLSGLPLSVSFTNDDARLWCHPLAVLYFRL
jgi:hypothetical protein